MGFFESSVVVYLREIAYPEGFCFPLKALSHTLSVTEILRELFSMAMLISISFLLTKRGIERFAWFLYNFAVWDIFYYIFLKLLIGWPESFLTTDILFLIPVIWTGPVLSPILLSVLMILLAVFILNFSKKIRYLRFRINELAILTSGSLLAILSFTLDYFIDSRSNSLSNIGNPLVKYIPGEFNWIIFGIGFLTITWGILLFFFHNKKAGRK